jgi:hypothetical protein
MSRYPESTFRINERDYPHVVELRVPSRDLRDKEFGSAVAAFHQKHRVPQKPGRRRARLKEGQWYVRYCFADPSIADFFADQFGGHRLMLDAVKHDPPPR